MPFDVELREKLLLWCERHCCLCGKQCDVFIEVHHIVPAAQGGGDVEDNAIPLCFDCHARVSHYDSTQPVGTKFKPSELKKRRDQIYDSHTRHLIPSVAYRLVYRPLPDVGFTIRHPGSTPPIRVRVTLDTYVDGVLSNAPDLDPLYHGGLSWNLNPGEGVNGHFPVHDAACRPGADVRTGISLELFDVYDRPHRLLPVTYVLSVSGQVWWLDPLDVRARVGGAAQQADAADEAQGGTRTAS